jgi:hypothetical protein
MLTAAVPKSTARARCIPALAYRPNKVWCESKHYKKTITCELQACGDARCKPCPDWFGPLKNLVIKAWCSYVCKDGETVVGSSAYVITAWDPYQLCILP